MKPASSSLGPAASAPLPGPATHAPGADFGPQFRGERAEYAGSVPRPALVQELDRLLFAEASHLVLLVGGPGRGKSALLTQYLAHLESGSAGQAGEPAKKPGFLARLFGGGKSAASQAAAQRRIPYHFLRRGVSGTAQPAEVARSLAEQIEASYPDCRDPAAEPALRLAELLQRVSSRVLVPSNQRLVIVIDGLDEAEQAELGNPLPHFLPETVPANVALLCAARAGDPNLDWLHQLRPRSLDLDDARWQAEGEAAVQAYWQQHGPRFAPKLPEAVVAEAVARAEGNLLHAALVRALLSALPAEQRTAARIPRGLLGLWQQTLTHVQALPAEPRQRALQALGLLAAAQAALPAEPLAELLGGAAALAEVLQLLRPVLLPLPASPEAAPPSDLRLPGSLRDYVAAQLGSEAMRAHQHRFAEIFATWPAPSSEFHRRYGLRFGLLHRALAADPAGALLLARDVGYLQSAAKECGAAALCTELAQAAAALPDGAAQRELLDLHHAIRRELQWLGRLPTALPGLLYNRLICLGWSPARIASTLRFPAGLPLLQLRFPLQQDDSASERAFLAAAPGPDPSAEPPSLQRCLVLPDSRVLVGSGDGALHLWQLGPSGQRLLWSVPAHSGPVHALLGLPDDRALSAGADGLLKVWELGSGRELGTLRGHTGAVQCCALLAAGRRVVSGGADGTLRLWELATGTPLRTLADGKGAILSCCAWPTGRLVTAAEDRVLKLWDLETGQVVLERKGQRSPVSTLLPLPDGRLVSASLDGTVGVWTDFAAGGEAGPELLLRGHSDGTSSCALLPGGRLLTGSLDGTLRISRLDNGATLGVCAGHSGWVTDCALLSATQPGAAATAADLAFDASAAAGTRVVSTSLDGTVRVWDTGIAERLHAQQGHHGFVTALALMPESAAQPERPALLSASRDHTLKLWELATGRHLRTLTGHAASVDECVVLPDGTRAVSASYDATLKVWDLASGQVLSTMRGHSGWVSSCAALPGSESVVSAAMDGTLRVWDARTGQQLRALVGHEDSITACALSPSGEQVVSASADGTLRVWSLATGAQLQALHGHTAAVDRCAMVPDGERVLSASADGTLKLWDLRTGAHLQTLAGHGAWISACALLPGGEKVLSASGDETLRVWDLRTGQTLRTLVGHRAAIYNCSPLPDGRRAVSAAGDGMLKLWDLETGECLWTVHGTAAAGFFSVLAVKDWVFAGDVLGNVWMLSCP
jgi:WD40 repeat protein